MAGWRLHIDASALGNHLEGIALKILRAGACASGASSGEAIIVALQRHAEALFHFAASQFLLGHFLLLHHVGFRHHGS